MSKTKPLNSILGYLNNLIFPFLIQVNYLQHVLYSFFFFNITQYRVLNPLLEQVLLSVSFKFQIIIDSLASGWSQVKSQTELRKTPVSEARKTPVTQTPSQASNSQFIPIHHPGAFPPLPSRPGKYMFCNVVC